jgi:multiple sugar transport system substrate-binding protein
MSHPSNRITRRDFLRVSGIAAAGAVLAACGEAPATSRIAASGPVQLVYQDWRTEWFPAMAQEMLSQFHAQNPNIRVFYTPDPENLQEVMLADMEAGTAPDVFSGCCDFYSVFAQKGYTLDLRPLIEADLDKAIIDDWSQAQYKALALPDGNQFALPKYHGALALYYNKDMFDTAGVDYPQSVWTYDDYLSAMKILTLRSGDQITQWGSMFDVTWDRIQVHVNGWGGHFVNPQDPTKCEMAAQPALDAMEWLRARMWDDKVMASFLDVENVETRQAFANQKIAMVEDGSWALKDILTQANFRVGVTPFPTGPVRHATLGTTDGFSIYAGTKNPEAAWELMKFLVSEDYGKAMARAHFLQPARASIIEDWAKYIREAYPEKAKDMDLNAFADGHIKGYSVTSETFKNMVGVSQISDEAWEKIFTLGQAPVSSMSEACQQIEMLQKGSSGAMRPCDCLAPSAG